MILKVLDYTRWSPERSRTGGEYGYEEAAVVLDGMIVNGEYWTTSELPYCQFCGSFESRLQDHLERCGEYIPSLSMEQALEFVLAHGEAEAVSRFAEWGSGLRLEVKSS